MAKLPRAFGRSSCLSHDAYAVSAAAAASAAGRVLAQDRVVGAAGDRVRVERGLAAPSCERTERAVAAQLREDQLAVDPLIGREVAVLDRLESREPLVVESIALAKALGGEI